MRDFWRHPAVKAAALLAALAVFLPLSFYAKALEFKIMLWVIGR